jgi:hypothetical protein
MASSKSVTRAARLVALTSGAQTELRHSAEQFSATALVLNQYANELTPDVENLRQTAIGAQAEAVRASMYALATRAAADTLAIVAVLLADEGGAQ